MKVKNVFLITGFLISGGISSTSLAPTQAATIGQLSLGENNTVIDSDQNLAWLKLTESVNKSIQEVMANPTSGYRVATGTEVARLFSGLGNSDALKFSELFGSTLNLGFASLSLGLFSPDNSPTTTSLAGAYAFSFGGLGFNGLVEPTNLGLPNNQVVPFAGVFQVRNIQPVPEPITIIGSGIALGFGATLKQKLARKNQANSKNT